MAVRSMIRSYAELPRSVHVLCLGTFINRAGTFIVVFLTLYLKDELNMTVEFATWAMGAFGLGSLGAALVGGHLADAIGRRVVMLWALFGGAVLLIVLSAAKTPAGVIAVVVAFAFVAEMYRPAASAMIADLVDTQRRPLAYSLMYISINLGFAIAPVVGGFLAERSFLLLFWGDAATSAVYALIILLVIRETLPAANAGPANAGPATAAEDSAGPEAPRKESWLSAMRIILTDGAFMTFCLGSLLIGMVYMQAMSTFPLYLNERGIDPAGYGRIIAVNGLLIALFQLPCTSIVNRFHRGTLVALAAFTTAIGFGLIGVVEGFGAFVVTVIIWTIGEMMMAPMVPSIVSDLAPVHLRARYMGVLGMCFSGANTIGAPIGGLVLSRLGGAYVWAGTFLLASIAGLLYASIRSRLAVREVQPAVA